MYFNMFGTDMVVLNSSEAMEDLLDKRSAIYSDKVGTPSTFFSGMKLIRPLVISPINSLDHQ